MLYLEFKTVSVDDGPHVVEPTCLSWTFSPLTQTHQLLAGALFSFSFSNALIKFLMNFILGADYILRQIYSFDMCA